MAGADQQQQAVQEFAFGEAGAGLLVVGVDECGGDVLAGVAALGLDQAGELHVDGLAVADGLLGRGGGVEEPADARAERVVQFLGDAEQGVDHHQRQHPGELLAQVDGAALRQGGEAVEEFGGDPLDLGGEGADPAGGERGADQPAQAAVFGSVGGERAADVGPHPQRPVLGDLPVDVGGPVLVGVLGDAGVGEQALDQGGVGDGPGGDAAGQFDPGGGSEGAQGGGLAGQVGSGGVESVGASLSVHQEGSPAGVLGVVGPNA